MHEIVCHAIEPADFNVVRRVDGFENISSEYPAYLTDESKFSCRPFDHLFFPRSEAELSAVMEEMARRGIKITIAGARTGLVAAVFRIKAPWCLSKTSTGCWPCTMMRRRPSGGSRPSAR